MSVIQATSAGVKDMADGSLRITLEFDPRYAKEAYSLFGARGTACAIAALTTEAATNAARQETIATPAEPKMRPGPLCIMACTFCEDPVFWRWVKEDIVRCDNADQAKAYILDVCDIESRKAIDCDPRAAGEFHKFIREPFLKWKAKQ